MRDPLLLSPTPTPNTFRAPDGRLLTPPPDWTLVPPGDPALTRRLKLAGPSWLVQEKVGRKLFSRGLYAPAATVTQIRAALELERADPAYAKKQAAAAARRDRDQTEYVHSFKDAVLAYLNFHPAHSTLADQLATAITTHATPVGSGTVARTERIPLEDRAEAACIAWLRHQTTTYDHMTIPRVKGKRREVRRLLAAQSKRLLDAYRSDRSPDPGTCPLRRALSQPTAATQPQ